MDIISSSNSQSPCREHFTNKIDIANGYIEKVILPSSSNLSDKKSSVSSEENQLFILKLKEENKKSRVKVYRSMETLKSRVAELVLKNSEHYAETE